MKRIKRFASVVLAAAMVMTTALPAFAADNHEHMITVKHNASDGTQHTYDAYQIFKGDLSANSAYDAEKNPNVPPYFLSNIEWGKNVDGETILRALKGDTKDLVSENTDEDGNGENLNYFRDCKSAASVAAVLATLPSSTSNNSTMLDKVASIIADNLNSESPAGTKTTDKTNGDVNIKVTGSGYYLVRDRENTVQNQGAATRFLLQVVGDSTVTVKSDVPHGDKQIYQVVSDSNGVYRPVSADANYGTIGSHVAYVISSQVPNYTGYNYYYFVMNDKLDKGLTFDGKNTVSVNIISKNGVTTNLVQGTDYYVYENGDKDLNGTEINFNGRYTFRLGFADIMKYEIGSKIEVTYTATVNDKAVIGVSGNANTWSLTYSNNPDETYGGEPGDQPNPKPGLPLESEEKENVFGQTPDEKTLTYLTELDITKYANGVSKKNLLAGAEFTLTGTSHQVVLNNVTYFKQDKNGEWYLLKNGTYTKQEPSEKEIDWIEIGVGTKDTTTGYISENNGSETIYKVPEDTTMYNGKTLYQCIKKKGTSSNYVDVNTKYISVNATKKEVVSVNVSIQHMTAEDGKISFVGLGEGTYTLTETVTPDGFNTMEPITFTITCKTPDTVTDGKELCEWDIQVKGNKLEINQNADTSGKKLGIFSANIINKNGSLLPSTGGIGTTIFYIIGGILVLGAAILLITKKRMSREA